MAWYNDVSTFFRGQRPQDVALPPELRRIQEQERELATMLGGQAMGTAETPGQLAARQAAAAQQEALQRAMSARAGAGRGIGRLATELGATQELAQAQQGLAGQAMATEAQARAADQARATQALMALLGQQRQGAMSEEEWRRAQTKGGFLPVLTGIGGAALGGAFGGPQGAQAGGQFGGALGSMFTR